MVKGGLYWHRDEATQVNHIYARGVSLCGKMMYGGPDRHEFVNEAEACCSECIVESQARRARASRMKTDGGGNGEKGRR